MCIFSFYDVTVSLNGDGDFSSIEAAIAQAPEGDSPYVIFIRRGVYQESFEITRDHIVLIGEDRDQTIITASVANGMLDSSGRKFATFGSRTLSINASGFSARTLTICNGFDFPANQKKPTDDPGRLRHTQAVALLVAPQGDKVQLKDVRLISYHDTFYLYAGRTYIHQSMVTGTVDFIFGGGSALFEDCDIVARNRDDVRNNEPYGYLVAPCTPSGQATGFVFDNCRLTKEPGVPPVSYGLGRPWHPTTQFDDGSYADPDAIGHAVFMHCQMDDHLYGWDKMSGRDKNQETTWFYPQDSRFWEYRNSGSGADSGGDNLRPQLSASQIAHYSVDSVFSGWIPDISAGNRSVLQGQVSSSERDSFPLTVMVTDALGDIRSIQTDTTGQYEVSIVSMTPPLLVCALTGNGPVRAFITDIQNNQVTIGNVNYCTEAIVAVCESVTHCTMNAERPVLPVSRRLWKQVSGDIAGL